jgi:hypothetical protein
MKAEEPYALKVQTAEAVVYLTKNRKSQSKYSQSSYQLLKVKITIS